MDQEQEKQNNQQQSQQTPTINMEVPLNINLSEQLENQKQNNEQKEQINVENLSELEKYKKVKLPNFQEEFKNLLEQELLMIPIQPLSQEKSNHNFEQLLEQLSQSELNKVEINNIIKLFCRYKVENNTEQLSNFIENVKNYIKQDLLQQFQIFLENKEKQFNNNNSTNNENQESQMQVEQTQEDKKQQFSQYLDKYKEYIEQMNFEELVPTIQFENKDYGYQNNISVKVENEKTQKVFELKITDVQDYTDDLEEVKHIRNLRNLKKQVLVNLNKLIKQIEKTKKDSEVSKIDDMYTKYMQCKQKYDNPPAKKEKKILNKTTVKKDQNNDGYSSDTSIKSEKKVKKTKNNKPTGEEGSIQNGISKIKLDSNNITPAKGEVSKSKKTGKKSNSKSPNKDVPNKAATSVKKIEKGQKTLTNFFQIKNKPIIKPTPEKIDIQQVVQPIIPIYDNKQQDQQSLQKQNNDEKDKMKEELAENPENQQEQATKKQQVQQQQNVVPKKKPYLRNLGSNQFYANIKFTTTEQLEQFEKQFGNKQLGVNQNNNNIIVNTVLEGTLETSKEILGYVKNESNKMKQVKRKLHKKHPQGRKIYIQFDGSKFGYKNEIFNKTSKQIKPTKPDGKDEDIDYDKDSDEEIQDANGEDLEQSIGEEESDEESQVEGLHIVDDGYLSQGEGGSEDESQGQENYNVRFQKKMQQITNNEDKSFFYLNSKNDRNQDNQKAINYFKNSQIIILDSVKPVKLVKDEQDKELKKASDPFIKNPQVAKAFCIYLHGNYNAKDNIIKEFKNQEIFQELSKEEQTKFTIKIFKQKIKDISNYEKNDMKFSWYIVYKSHLEKYDIENEQINEILEKRKAENKIEQDNKKREKKEKKEQEKKEKLELLKQQQLSQENQSIIKEFMEKSNSNQIKHQQSQKQEEQNQKDTDCEIVLEEINFNSVKKKTVESSQNEGLKQLSLIQMFGGGKEQQKLKNIQSPQKQQNTNSQQKQPQLIPNQQQLQEKKPIVKKQNKNTSGIPMNEVDRKLIISSDTKRKRKPAAVQYTVDNIQGFGEDYDIEDDEDEDCVFQENQVENSDDDDDDELDDPSNSQMNIEE